MLRNNGTLVLLELEGERSFPIIFIFYGLIYKCHFLNLNVLNLLEINS